MRVNSTDFQNSVGRYLSLAQKEDVIITKNGKNMAKLIAYTEPEVFLVNESTREYKVKRRISYEEYLDYVNSSDQRYELIDGEVYLLASPSFRHQVLVRELLISLSDYLTANPCQVLSAPFDIRLYGYATKFSEDPNVVQPDIVVICDPENVTADGKYEGTPTLVVEVLSPSTKSKDHMLKLHLYIRSGIAEYWIVDPESKTMWQYSASPERELDIARVYKQTEIMQSIAFPELTLDLAKLFA